MPASAHHRGALAAVLALTVAGAVLRIVVAGQSLFGDELSTQWIVTENGFGGAIATVHDDLEITPPLYFALAWLTTRIAETPEMLRLPSLIVGTAAIPLAYVIGLRTVGRRAGLVAAALLALSPYLIYYSAEARAYQLMIVLVMLSTLALLSAVASGRTRWWVAYAACTSAAVWAHYTSIFVLAAQLVWVLWAHPQGRRAAIAATVAAIVAFLPWTTGVINDLRLPDSEIMSELTPFTPHAVRLALEHWSVGYPYVTSSTELRDLPGVAALSLQALGLAIGIAALAAAAVRGRRGRLDREVVLVVALALATPLGEALVSAAGSHLLSARNLAASWPWFALALGALLVAAGPRLGIAASALVIAGFAAGALKMTQTGFHRPDFEGAAALVEREAAPEDVVIDGAVALITPGPLTGLDAALTHARPTVRAGASQRREGNFRIGDRVIPVQAVVRGAADSGRPVFVVSTDSANTGIEAFWDPLFAATPRGYRRAAKHTFPGFIPLAVLLYDRRTLPAR